MVLACMLFAGLAFLVACGSSKSTGGGSPGTPAGTYAITVTGTGNGVPQVSQLALAIHFQHPCALGILPERRMRVEATRAGRHSMR